MMNLQSAIRVESAESLVVHGDFNALRTLTVCHICGIIRVSGTSQPIFFVWRREPCICEEVGWSLTDQNAKLAGVGLFAWARGTL
jgi:hypothetical protein